MWWTLGLATPPAAIAAAVLTVVAYGHHLNRRARTARLERRF